MNWKKGLKVIVVGVVAFYLLHYLEVFIAKKVFSSKKIPSVEIEVGDIIFRSNSYLLANSRYYRLSGFPGHVAIFVDDGLIDPDDIKMAGLRVAESRSFDRKVKVFKRKMNIQPARENFGGYKGGRILLKMHLNVNEKKKLLQYLKKQEDKPYKIFDSKKDDSSFNCATLVRNAILYATGEDIDVNGGIVLPVDLVRCEKFDAAGDRINF